MKRLDNIEEIQNYLNEINYPFSMSYYSKIGTEDGNGNTIKENFQDLTVSVYAGYDRNKKVVVDELSKLLSVIDFTGIQFNIRENDSGRGSYALTFSVLLNNDIVKENKLLKDNE